MFVSSQQEVMLSHIRRLAATNRLDLWYISTKEGLELWEDERVVWITKDVDFVSYIEVLSLIGFYISRGAEGNDRAAAGLRYALDIAKIGKTKRVIEWVQKQLDGLDESDFVKKVKREIESKHGRHYY